MTATPDNILIEAGAHEQYNARRLARLGRLVGPQDDMWATFADLAEPHAILVEGRVVGCCSIDADTQLHGFHIDDPFEELTETLFDHVIDTMAITAAMPSTVDPTFLALSLGGGRRAEPVALMYDLVAPSVNPHGVVLRLATMADHADAMAFSEAATGSAEAFLGPYLAERIERQELHLFRSAEAISALGECRVDQRSSGYAHLGVMVASALRGEGMGTRVMETLVEICDRQGLTPLCSTEPENTAAQHVIRNVGFRARHRVFRVRSR